MRHNSRVLAKELHNFMMDSWHGNTFNTAAVSRNKMLNKQLSCYGTHVTALKRSAMLLGKGIEKLLMYKLYYVHARLWYLQCLCNNMKHTNGLAQGCSTSSANALEILQSCAEPLKCLIWITKHAPHGLIHYLLGMPYGNKDINQQLAQIMACLMASSHYLK